MKKTILFLLIIFVALSTSAQTDTPTFSKPLRFLLEGTIIDVDTGIPIEDATVKLIGTDSSSITTKTDSLGFYSFELKPTTAYTISVHTNNYYSARGQETTFELKESTKFIHDFKLQTNRIICIMQFPEFNFKPNKFKPHFQEPHKLTIYEMYYLMLTDNPHVIIQIEGFRDESEKDKTSEQRVNKFKQQIVRLGVNETRIKTKDGGISESSTNPRTVHFKILSDN